MGLVVKHWVHEEGLPRWGARNVRVLIQQLMYDMAEAASSQDLHRQRAKLSEQVAVTMSVDPAFVEKALIGRACSLFQGQAIGRLDQENLMIAMNVEPFRRLLGVKLLDAIDDMLGERRER